MEGPLRISYIASTRRRSESSVMLGIVSARGLKGLNRLIDGTDGAVGVGGVGSVEATASAGLSEVGGLLAACSSCTGRGLLDVS